MVSAALRCCLGKQKRFPRALREARFWRSISGSKEAEKEDAALKEAEALAAEKKAGEDAEALRQARLASLNGISEEDLGRLANEIGINPADCKDQADVLKKVKAALKKG